MQQKDVLGKSGDPSLSQSKVIHSHPRLPLPVVATLLVLTTLACAWAGPDSPRVVIRANLPTLTPTPGGMVAAESLTLTPAILAPQGSVVTVEATLLTPAMPTLPPAASPDDLAATAAPTLLPDFTTTPMTLPTSQEASETRDLSLDTPAAMPTPVLIVPATTGSRTTPTPIVIPTITPIPETSGWSFAKVRTYSDQLPDGLLLYGLLINETGASQKLRLVTGDFFDGQGQKIAGQDNSVDFWPVEIVPPGGEVPFELAVDSIQAAADYKLWVHSESTAQTPQQAFHIAAVEQWQEEALYCLAGSVQIPASGLEDYLVVVAVLYDDQGNVVNFGEDYRTEPGEEASEGQLAFEICIDPPNQRVARYELKAWGE